MAVISHSLYSQEDRTLQEYKGKDKFGARQLNLAPLITTPSYSINMLYFLFIDILMVHPISIQRFEAPNLLSLSRTIKL